MVCWQMPHFYSIGMYRLKDYEAAGLPILPAVRGARHTKLEIMAYIAAYAIICTSLTLTGCTGLVFLAGMLLASAAWFWQGYAGFKTDDDTVWAKRMFRLSLKVLLLFSLLQSFNWLLP
jgi:protoheme IX farnesyltransferase